MAHTRLLLIGRGHLGTFLRERLGVPPELHWKEELESLDAAALRRLAPDAVVNTAGKTDLGWCEAHADETFRCNVRAPLALWRAVQAALPERAPFIHFSSGCVWDGPYKEDGAPFEPDDPPRPACFYSWTKAACDALLLRETAGRPLVILRPRQVYSPLNSPRNTLVKLRLYPRLIETPNSMTSAETIARTLERLLALPLARLPRGRIIAVYDRGITSPFEVGRMLAQAGLREEPARMPRAELDAALKPKRVDAVLHDAYFETLADPPEVGAELERAIRLFAEQFHAPGAGGAGPRKR
jgi:dTDP-4-dehydrorhamnose reductase